MAEASNVISLDHTKRKSDPLDFAPVSIEFAYSNQEWCASHLLTVRLALTTVAKTKSELCDLVDTLKEEMLLELLDQFRITQEHLRGLAEMIGTAEARMVVACEAT